MDVMAAALNTGKPGMRRTSRKGGGTVENQFGEWMQRMMEDRGWTGAELARQAGMSEAHISRLVSGARTPGIEACRQIAQAFAVNPLLAFSQAGLIHPDEQALSPLEQEVCTLLAELPEWARRVVLVQVRALRRNHIDVAELARTK